jgi:hypothetical protein
MAKQDIELGAISEIIRSNGMAEAVKYKITHRVKTKDGFRYPFFKEGSIPERVIDFMYNHYDQHKTTPSLETMEKHFKGFELQDYSEPLSYWFDQLRSQRKYNMILETVREVGQELQAKNVLSAESILKKAVSQIQAEINIAKDMIWNLDVESRIDRYTAKKESLGLIGLPFGIEPLDKATGGIQPSQLITITAMPKTGKSWLEVFIAAVAMSDGKDILFITREMRPEEIADRLDVYFFALNTNHHKLGQLGDMKEEDYFEELRKLKDRDDIGQFIISGDSSHGFGVSAVQAKIEEYNPDLVIVDGSYLLEDEDGGTAMWEKVTNITRKLKRVANSTGKPIIQSSQLSAKSGKEGKANSQSNISFSQSFAQDSDLVIEPFRDKDMKALNKMGINVMLAREADVPLILLNWDFENMKTFGTVAEVMMDDDVEDDDDSPIIFS